MKVKEAAKLLGKSEQFVRIGLQRGIFAVLIRCQNVERMYLSDIGF